MSDSVVESWSPKKQVHILNLKKKTAIYKGPNFKANLDVTDDKRIKWQYVEDLSNTRKAELDGVIFKYTYIRKNHKIITSVNFGPMYLTIVSTQGTCTEH